MVAESYLEETYYHRFNPPQGYGFQRVYTDDRGLDEAISVENGDVVMVPEGYHPFATVHGYDSYYPSDGRTEPHLKVPQRTATRNGCSPALVLRPRRRALGERAFQEKAPTRRRIRLSGRPSTISGADAFHPSDAFNRSIRHSTCDPGAGQAAALSSPASCAIALRAFRPMFW
jgi:hypothetical protein